MNAQDILQQFESINTWKKKGVRAPHKPLLMLLALGEIQRGNTGFIPYSTIEPKLKELLRDLDRLVKPFIPTFLLSDWQMILYDSSISPS